MKLSIKKLIKELQDLTAAHNQIKTFEYGDFLTIIKKNIDYTCVMANVSNATNRTSQNLINLQVDLFVCDKTLKGDENKVTVENNTLQILNDLLGVISYSPRWQEFGVVTTSTPYRKYYDRTADVVTGWSATITFEVIHKNGFCDVPIFDYDYDQSADDECTVLVTVINTDSDVLATKVVSDSDNTVTVPNITFTDSDGTTSSQPAGVNLTCTPVADATVENSNESYSTTVAGGGTLVLPDITVTDSDGSTYIQPSVQDVVCTPSSGTATVENSDASYNTTVASGGTLVLPDITVTDSDGSTYTQPSVQDVVCTLESRDVFIKCLFFADQDGTDVANAITIDSDNAGTFDNYNQDGSSGTITFYKNGVLQLDPTVSDLVLVATDTLRIERTVSSAAGFVKLTGLY